MLFPSNSIRELCSFKFPSRCYKIWRRSFQGWRRSFPNLTSQPMGSKKQGRKETRPNLQKFYRPSPLRGTKVASLTFKDPILWTKPSSHPLLLEKHNTYKAKEFCKKIEELYHLSNQHPSPRVYSPKAAKNKMGCTTLSRVFINWRHKKQSLKCRLELPNTWVALSIRIRKF